MLHHALKRTLTWLKRFRHRCGYGIHSPFAFQFVTGVVYERGHYYADAALRAHYAQCHHRQGLRLKDCRLLFRLANFQHPRCCRLLGYKRNSLPVQFMQAGSCHTHYVAEANEQADMVVASADAWPRQAQELIKALPIGGMLVLVGVSGANKAAWQQLLQHPNACIAFDLYYFGIVFRRPDLQRQHYIVNYY